MRSIVSFIANRKNDGRRGNPTLTKSFGRVGFIDYGYSGTQPKPGEHWMVAIQRENLSAAGGAFVIRPIEQVKEYEPLQINGYTLSQFHDVVLVMPKNPGNWVLSPSAKASILRATPEANAIVISLDGDTTWERRPPPEQVLSRMANALARA